MPQFSARREGYTISDDPTKFDFATHSWLSK
jgi:hypothetical protein